MNPALRIGIIGCDTSHCSRFAEQLSGGRGAGVLAGAEIVAAYPGEGEAARLEKFTRELSALGVPLMESVDQVLEVSDALMILSADGACHAALFQQVAVDRKPVFIDKPLAQTVADAEAIFRESERKSAPVFSASALRFSRPYCESLRLAEAAGGVVGLEVAAPATWLTREQGLFYYGIHGVEMLFAALGPECMRVSAFSHDAYDLCVGEWTGGRVGVFRGNRTGDKRFCAQIHTELETRWLASALPEHEPLYIPLLEEVIPFLRSGVSPISPSEMVRVIRFITAAAESAEQGRVIGI